MRNTLKKAVGVVMVVALMLGVLAVPSQDAQAADVSKKAGKAFAKALEQKKIKYNGQYCLCDINSDGVKELIIKGKDSSLHYVIWRYANGKVSKLAEFDGEGDLLAYDKKSRVFWNLGDGDGGWMHPYKLNNGKFRDAGASYYITADGKKAEKGTKKISVKKYRKIENHVVKNNAIKMKKLGKSKLILKLQKKKVYTSKDFNLSSDDPFTYKGIQIIKLSSKSIQYKKIKQQPNDMGDAEWLPYDRHVFEMKYSKKIDVYLLNQGDSNKWVKMYDGISYKKMQKCLSKYISRFVLIKNKKGRVTKMVELFQS